VRSFSQVPVIVVSARAEPDGTVEALDLGADDYVCKPFNLEELLARVRAATRRGVAGAAEPVVQVGQPLIDIADSKATRDGAIVHLTPTEWKIVSVLVRNRGRLVHQVDLLHEVWGPGYERDTNYLRLHLASIRPKLDRRRAARRCS
jgi:two-component system KDP operon response regulator KdpE